VDSLAHASVLSRRTQLGAVVVAAAAITAAVAAAAVTVTATNPRLRPE
jgi:hypothetical protein